MKKYILMIKEKLPIFQKRLVASLPFILVYQAILFIISPIKLNQILLVILIVIFTLLQFASKD
ncbi:MAG: hypothetical protein SOW55_01905 [Bacilli bacterium]|nr:hypothetical protein [Bacillales bacterium]MDY2574724.1 hypothetical protein [Bacilli bacterium]